MSTLSTELQSAVAYLREVSPNHDEACQRLYQGAIDNGNFLATDFFTLRDWLETTGYARHTSLHALLILLMLALDEGSLCLALDEPNLRKRLETFIGPEDASMWARRIDRDLKENDFSRMIGEGTDSATPLVRQKIQNESFLFFQKALHDERRLLAALEDLLKRNAETPRNLSLTALAAITDEVLAKAPLRRGGATLELDPDQLTALGLVLLRPLAVISGGPGTGKTSIVLTMLRCLVRCGIAPERIALAAPTGRAAQRLADALRGFESAGALSPLDASLASVRPTTLHQLLGYIPSSGHFRRHPENPVAADVVIVDEVSMVGLNLMAQLFHGLAPATRLVLLGDKDQLPSVEAGAVLAHLLPEGFQPQLSPDVQRGLTQLFGDLWGAHSVLPAPRQETRRSQGRRTGASSPQSLFDHQQLRDTVALLRVNHRSEKQIQEAAQAINLHDQEAFARLPRLTAAELRDQGDLWQRKADDGGCHVLAASGSAGPRELRLILTTWARHAYFAASTARGAYPELARRCVLPGSDPYDEPTQELLRDLFALLDRARLLTLVREGPSGCVEINKFLARQLGEFLGWHKRTAFVPGTPVLVTQNDHVRHLYNGDVGIALASAPGGMRVVFERQGGFLSLPAESLPAHELGFALTVHKSQGSEYDQVLLVFPPEGARRLLTRELVYTAITRARRLAVLYGKEEVIRQAIAHRIEREAGWLRTLHSV